MNSVDLRMKNTLLIMKIFLKISELMGSLIKSELSKVNNQNWA